MKIRGIIVTLHLILGSLLSTHSAALTNEDSITEHEYVTSQFVRLASIHSCSTERVSISNTFPNVPEDSITILEAIAQELALLGVHDVKFNDRAVLLATLPASYGTEDVNDAPPSLALVSHVDQSGAYALNQVGMFSIGRRGLPNTPTRVKPRVYPNWNGTTITFPDAPDLIMSIDHVPRLNSARNKTLITTSGGSPLGADGLAGAVSMLALARRWSISKQQKQQRSPQCTTEKQEMNEDKELDNEGECINDDILPGQAHGPIRLVFLPAGELGAAQWFLTPEDLRGAEVAYILDAETPGDIRYESPLFVQYELKIQAYRMHAALGAGVSHDYPSVYGLSLCNVPSIASQIVAAVADSRYAADKSIDREPFIEVKKMEFGEDSLGGVFGHVEYFARALEHDDISKVALLLENATNSVRQRYAKCANITLLAHPPTNINSWYLMGKDAGPVRLARAAMRAAGLVPISTPLRSSTDAVYLSNFGVPTMVLYSAWHAAHGPLEWTTTEEMMQVTDVVQSLAGLWLQEHSRLKWCPVGVEYDPEDGVMNGPAA